MQIARKVKFQILKMKVHVKMLNLSATVLEKDLAKIEVSALLVRHTRELTKIILTVFKMSANMMTKLLQSKVRASNAQKEQFLMRKENNVFHL